MFPQTLILILSFDNHIVCFAVFHKQRFLVVILSIYTPHYKYLSNVS
jgi:hypothetical protein